MKLVFNMGWWFEHSLFIIKNRLEDQDPAPRKSIYNSWAKVYTTYFYDSDYRRYNGPRKNEYTNLTQKK